MQARVKAPSIDACAPRPRSRPRSSPSSPTLEPSPIAWLVAQARGYSYRRQAPPTIAERSIEALVLYALDHAQAPATLRDIAGLLPGLPCEQVRAALYRLRTKELVRVVDREYVRSHVGALIHRVKWARIQPS